MKAIIILPHGEGGVEVRINLEPPKHFKTIGDVALEYATREIERKRLAIALENLACMLHSRTPDQANRLGYCDRLGSIAKAIREVLRNEDASLDFERVG